MNTSATSIAALLAATHVIARQVGDGLSDRQLTIGEAHLIALMPTSGIIEMKTLQRRSGNKASSLGSIVDRLEAKDLVTRERSSGDRRSVTVVLTEEGRQAASWVADVFEAEADRLARSGVDLSLIGAPLARIVGSSEASDEQ